MTMTATKTDLLSLATLSGEEIHELFSTARTLKRDRAACRDALSGKAMVMLFEKPSLRTRMSFEVGMSRLGGTAVYLDHQSARIGVRESVEDYGRNLERWVDVIVARTFAHATAEALAACTSIPVINALTDLYHPCQALADTFTLWERWPDLASVKVAWIGDGNNVCHSLLWASAKLGFDLTVIVPPGHGPDDVVLEEVLPVASVSGATITLTEDPDAVAGHHAVYTDTWISMGEKSGVAAKKAALSPYRVDATRMAAADPDAIFMHCLPAHRGDEVTAEVIDGPQSVVFDQAENRMHAQNAVLLRLLAS